MIAITHQQQNMHPASWKLTGEERLISISTTHEVDACSCKLTGGKLRVNHIYECMSSEVDWVALETHQNRDSITKVDWGDYDPTLYPMDGCILSEVDWGAHDSSFFPYLVHIDHDAQPKDFFTQGSWGGLPQRTSSTPLMEYLKDSLDTGQIEDGFSNSKSIKGYRGSYLFLILNNMKVATIYLLNGIMGRNYCNFHSSGRKAQVSSLQNKGE